jgi:general secretion pathway protein A
MLELTMPGGERRYATLVGFDGTRATLVLGDHRITVPLAQVDALWAGSFTVLWRPPAPAGTILAPGSRGPNVAWLQQRLDEISGQAARPGARDVYDEAVRARVIAFQRRQSLEPDGVVGEETLLRLVLAGTPRAPRLARAIDGDTGPTTRVTPAAKGD